MADEKEPRAQPQATGVAIGSGRILGLTDEERDMLREFAVQLRGRVVRNQVAREALDRAADQLDQAASLPQN
jgi:hypothetical protein